MPTPDRFKPEQDAVEALIRRAFRGVSREGGVSWSETFAIDSMRDEQECARARELDTDACWEDLIVDPDWDYDATSGGFNFLDAIGWRYYIAPAMVRCARDGDDGGIFPFVLQIYGELKEDQVRLLSLNQKHAAARFVRLMTAMESLDPYLNPWSLAYRMYWRQWDRGGLAT